MEGKKKEKPGNKVTITARRNTDFYVSVGKQTLANLDTIQLHALGSAYQRRCLKQSWNQ